jgi:uncharacterized membrane protein
MNPRRGIARWAHHLWVGPMHVRRAFPADADARIEQAIVEGERRHRAEVRFAVESSLDARELWRGATARDRAIEVFSEYRIWDTEEDNGVLVYLLWADRAVEVVADRGAARRVDAAVWRTACTQLIEGCRDGRQLDGALAALATINDALALAYPGDGRDNPDELPNARIVLG